LFFVLLVVCTLVDIIQKVVYIVKDQSLYYYTNEDQVVVATSPNNIMLYICALFHGNWDNHLTVFNSVQETLSLLSLKKIVSGTLT